MGGMRELRSLKKWKDALKKEFEDLDSSNKDDKDAVPAIHAKTHEEVEDEEMAEIDKQIDELKDEERRAARRKKKKELKEKQKRVEKINLKMILPGDEGPTAAEEGLFRMSDLKNKDHLDTVVNDSKVDVFAEDSGDEETDVRPKHGEDSNEDDSDSDDGEELGLDSDEDDSDEEIDKEIEKQDEISSNPLIESLTNDDQAERKSKKAEMWFQKIGDIEEDSDLEEAEIMTAVDIVKKKGGSIKQKNHSENEGTIADYHSDSDDEDVVGNIHNDNLGSASDDSDSEEEAEHRSASGKVYNKDGFEIVPKQKIRKRKPLSCEELALGEQLVQSKKARRDIMDNGWNRYMFNDENLPDWFVKEEELHMKKKPDIDPDVVEK